MVWDTNVFIAEVFGTGLLVILGDGVVAGVLLAKSKAQNAGWIVITAAWAFAVCVGVVVAGPISGAHLNPAVTIGLAVHRRDPWDMVPVYLIGEFVGAFIGAILVTIHYWRHLRQTEDPGLKLAVFSTGPDDPEHPANLVSRDHRHVRARVRASWRSAPTASAAGLAALGALPVAFLVWSIGLSLGGTDRLRDQPRPRPRAADHPRHPADPRQGRLGLGLLLGPGRRPGHRRRPGRASSTARSGSTRWGCSDPLTTVHLLV